MSTAARNSENAPRRPAIILVASDQEWSARSFESILAPHGYAVVRANTGQQTLDLVRGVAPDAVILDTRTLDMTGVEVCRMLDEEPQLSRMTPIFVLSAGGSPRSDRLSAYEAGAWQYLSHPIDGEAFLLQLRNVLAARQESDRIREENLIDDPTGLYSMRGLVRRSREIGAEAVRRKMPLSCLAVAPAPRAHSFLPASHEEELAPVVDHIALILLSCGRVSDAIGRFGHSEFGVVAPATDAAGALKLVERIRVAVEKEPLRIRGHPLSIEIKAGFQSADNFASSPIDAFEMLMRASTDLHQALGGGTTVSAV